MPTRTPSLPVSLPDALAGRSWRTGLNVRGRAPWFPMHRAWVKVSKPERLINPMKPWKPMVTLRPERLIAWLNIAEPQSESEWETVTDAVADRMEKDPIFYREIARLGVVRFDRKVIEHFQAIDRKSRARMRQPPSP
jgi:hypothetical protein